MGRLRDVQGSLQLDVPLPRINNIGGMVLSFGALFESLKEEPLGRKIVINTKEITTIGDIWLFQSKLTVPAGPSGVSIPVSLTWSNRTELIVEKKTITRLNVGLTLDLDKLLPNRDVCASWRNVRVANDLKLDRPSFIGKAFRIAEGEPVSIRLGTPAAAGPRIELDDENQMSAGIIVIDPAAARRRSERARLLGAHRRGGQPERHGTGDRRDHVGPHDLRGEDFAIWPGNDSATTSTPNRAPLIFCGIHGWVRPNGRCPH